MSTITETGRMSDHDFVEAVVPLLKEYTDKLTALSQQALDGQKNLTSAGSHAMTDYARALRDECRQRLQYLIPPANDLARQASGVLEQGRVNGLERVELWLRLSEFEAALETAKKLVERFAPKK
jgi:hypothetical protein